MEPNKRQIIQEWSTQVESIITADHIYGLTSCLQAGNILLPLQAEEIIHTLETDCVKLSLALLSDSVCRRGPAAFDAFCSAVGVLADPKLTSPLLYYCHHHIGLHFSHEFSKIHTFSDLQHNVCYQVDSSPAGYVLIINNAFEEDTHLHRRGSEKDVQNLETALYQLNYRVKTHFNLISYEMMEVVAEFAEMPEHDACHAAGVIIMSHGDVDGIKDCQAATVPVRRLLQPLKGPRSRLLGKPLFVVIQACRGDNEIDHTIVPFGLQELEGGSLKKLHQVTEYQEEVAYRTTNSTHTTSLQLPDSIIIYSALPSFVASRDPQHGALFIQAFCDALKKHGRTMPLHDLYTLIASPRHELQVKYSSFSAIIPQVWNSLRKTFYLNTSWITARKESLSSV